MAPSYKTKRWSVRMAVVGLLCMVGWAQAHPTDPIKSERKCHAPRRDVDLVLCLDTSGSMQGLIDSARARLWDVVNSLAQAKPTPRLRVGLLTYGSPSNSTASTGWIVQHTDLTTDLDTVYGKMMSMTIHGGDEFVGWVLHEAVQKMDWSRDPKALRLVFVAGNESADQAAEVYNFRTVATTARGKDITINAIYAGHHQAGINEHWDQVASCGGGTYSTIDMQCGTVQIETPHDKVLLELNLKLNATYLPYGIHGATGAANQQEQDRAADGMGAASEASRVAAKATALYDNARWDLVDAVGQGQVEVKDLKETALPPAMQALPAGERPAFVEKTRDDRAKVQRQINEVQAARETFLREARAQATGGKTALDDAVRTAIEEQAKAKGFAFE